MIPEAVFLSAAPPNAPVEHVMDQQVPLQQPEQLSGAAASYQALAALALQAADASLEVVNQLKKDREYWKDQSLIDTLTNVGSRRGLEQYLEEHDAPVALLFIDGDNIGEANKKLGHEVGDYTIVTLAEIIKSCIRPSDKVFRVGGDEFVVILGEPTETEESLEPQDLTAEEKSRQLHPSYVERKQEQIPTEHAAEHVRSVANIMFRRILDTGLYAGLRDMDLGLSVGGAIREEGMSTQQLFDAADIDMRMRKLEKLPNVTPRILEIHRQYLEDMAAEGLSPHILTKMAKAGLLDSAVTID